MEALIVMSLVCGVIGLLIDGGRGFILGLLLGIIGLVIAAVLTMGDKADKAQSSE